MPETPIRAVALARRSTRGQSESFALQEMAFETWARIHDAEIVQVTRETVNGSTPMDEREGLLAAIQAVEDHQANVLLGWRVDRISRDVVTLILVERELAKLGARFEFCVGGGSGDTPEGKLFRTLLGGVAEFEQDMIRLRKRAGKASRKAAGRATGPAPFGYRREGKALVPDPVEAPTVARVRELAEIGLGSQRIASILNAEGHAPRKGARWYPTQVDRIRKRAA